jgi:hypothetical protein
VYTSFHPHDTTVWKPATEPLGVQDLGEDLHERRVGVQA